MQTTHEFEALEQHRARSAALSDLAYSAARLPSAAETHVGGVESPTLTSYFEEIAQSLQNETFRVAVIGEYSSGKSSLLNVVLDLLSPEEKGARGILPINIRPTTAMVTTLANAPITRITLVYQDGRHEPADEQLWKALVTEPGLWDKFIDAGHHERLKAQAKQIAEVRIETSSPLLQQGIEIIDTPGLGSVHLSHAEITRRCLIGADAVLFVFGVDPPLGESQLTFLQYVRSLSSRFMFIQTMKDKGLEEERGELVWVTREREHRRLIAGVLGHDTFAIHSVSAAQASKGYRSQDTALLQQSGIPQLRAALAEFLTNESGRSRLEQKVRRFQRGMAILDEGIRVRVEGIEEELNRETGSFQEADDSAEWASRKLTLESRKRTMISDASENLMGIRGNLWRDVEPAVRTRIKEFNPESLRTQEHVKERLEREIIRTVQENASKAYEEVQTKLPENAKKLIEAMLSEEDKHLCSKFTFEYQPVELNVDLVGEALVETATSQRRKVANGFFESLFLGLERLFGGGYEEHTTYRVRADYVVEAARSVTEGLASKIGNRLIQHMRDVFDAGLEHLDRAELQTREERKERKAVASQSRKESEERLSALRKELQRLDRIRAEVSELGVSAR